MMIITMYSLMISMSVTFLWLKHPMSMGFILILQTLVIAMISGMTLNNFFFSYIITIIMLSGALVLFIYMASVASNEKFKTPINLMLMMMVMSFVAVYINNKFYPLSNYPKNNNESYGTILLLKLFNSMSSLMTMMMIIYLLLTMVIVSYIASNQEGPLRMKIYE
uniref:NADH dehydrogenase subunit 6 n=1 Tax=Tetrarthria variegata TaxID=2080413 RepID=A0A2P1CMP4_9HEMI|nr:NADH dehydrogenase subunit 6 [Tetrarthria variegata]